MAACSYGDVLRVDMAQEVDRSVEDHSCAYETEIGNDVGFTGAAVEGPTLTTSPEEVGGDGRGQ